MGRMLLAVLLTAAPVVAMAADDGRFSYLEQEVRNLQRQVLALTRQVDEMRSGPARLPARPVRAPAGAPAADNDAWLDAAKWRKLRVGMAELDVIGTLGRPTSMREDGGARVLLYAMEIGASGFLSGSVTLRDRVVAEIQTPELK